jgi:hypothetical protein
MLHRSAVRHAPRRSPCGVDTRGFPLALSKRARAHDALQHHTRLHVRARRRGVACSRSAAQRRGGRDAAARALPRACGRNLPRSSLSCFSDARARARLPRFRLVPAAEALMGLLFANLFWVGLWDLLDTTIFPFDSSYAMLLLVRCVYAHTRTVVTRHAVCPHVARPRHLVPVSDVALTRPPPRVPPSAAPGVRHVSRRL